MHSSHHPCRNDMLRGYALEGCACTYCKRSGRHVARAANTSTSKPEEDKGEFMVPTPKRFYRNGKALEAEIQVDMLDAAKDDVINEKDMNWWFTESPDDIIEDEQLEPAGGDARASVLRIHQPQVRRGAICRQCTTLVLQ